jgi:MFS family permease
MNWESTALTLRIIATFALIFVCYFIIGLQLAVVPVFVYWRLGFNPIIAGFAVSVQYVATPLSRPFAGRMGDTRGGKFGKSQWPGLAGNCQ